MTPKLRRPPRRGRAAPLAPDDRREALLRAVGPLLLRQGRAVTTRQIAEQAGIAEGTIFRVFESKDALVEAALARAFDPRPHLERLEAIDRGLPLRERLVALVSLLQERFTGIFSLMHAMGMVAPPEPHGGSPREVQAFRERVRRLCVELIGPDAGSLRVPPEKLVHLLHLLTFSGSHPRISHSQLLSPEEIVDVVLQGTLAGSRARTR